MQVFNMGLLCVCGHHAQNWDARPKVANWLFIIKDNILQESRLRTLWYGGRLGQADFAKQYIWSLLGMGWP